MSDDASSFKVLQDKIRALRMDEDEAIIGYQEVIALAEGHPDVKAVLESIAREEKVHIGELQALLDKHDPENAEATQEGAKEGEDLMTDVSKAWSDHKRTLRKSDNHTTPNQVSVVDQMNTLLAEVADIKTSIERLDDVVPELAGDVSAIEQESEDMEEIGMPEDVDGLQYEESFDETDSTDEMGSEEDVDTTPSEESEFGDKDRLPDREEVPGGEAEDDDTDQLEGEVGEDDGKGDDDVSKSVPVSAKGFSKLIRMNEALAKKVRDLTGRMDSVEAQNRILKAKLNSPVVNVSKATETQEKVIQRAKPMTDDLRKKAGVVVTNRPGVSAVFKGGDPTLLHKSLKELDEPLPAMGMGADGDDIVARMAKKIDAQASRY